MNIFDKTIRGEKLVLELIKSNNNSSLNTTPVTYAESYLSGLLMNNPILSVNGLVVLQRVSKKTVNKSTNILDDFINQIHTYGCVRFVPTKEDKEILNELYPVIRNS